MSVSAQHEAGLMHVSNSVCRHLRAERMNASHRDEIRLIYRFF